MEPSSLSRLRRMAGRGLMLAAALVLAACDESGEEAAAPEARPVRIAEALERAPGEIAALSGTIEAKTEADLGFRIGGRLVERLVNVGDQVEAGQPVARLDDEDERNALRAAEASLLAAEGQKIEAEANYARQRQLLERGFTTRQRYDEAAQVLRTLTAQVDAALAQVEIARRRLDDTVLLADASGAVTARGAEPGEVVQPGRMIVRIARDDGRDAVFDAPADVVARGSRDLPVEVSLSSDPSVTAIGRIREVSPQADAATGTFRVRVALDAASETMRLGSTVTGRVRLDSPGGVVIPASALVRAGGEPAVWVVDPATSTVSSRPVEIMLHRPSEVVLAAGLAPGEVVVTAGVQTLRAGQKVRLLGDRS